MRIKELSSRQALSEEFLPKNGIGCEMGVRQGDHAAMLLLSRPRELHLVDRWTNALYKSLSKKQEWRKFRQEVKDRFIPYPEVKIHDGDVRNVMPTFPMDYFDWIYIDTFHSFSEVSRDIELAIPRIKHGGILCGHDFVVDPKDWATGVVRAVIDLIQNGEGHRMVAISNAQYADWAVLVNKRRVTLL